MEYLVLHYIIHNFIMSQISIIMDQKIEGEKTKMTDADATSFDWWLLDYLKDGLFHPKRYVDDPLSSTAQNPALQVNEE